jgi:hypothetical protein
VKRICTIIAVAMLLTAPGNATAAELRLSYTELARLLGSFLGNAKIYLNSQPGFLGFTSPSSATLGNETITFELPKQPFQFGSSQYVYNLSDISSTSVRITAVPGAIRVALAFEDNGPEIVASCLSGPCNVLNALPQIEWEQPTIAIELVPDDLDGSLTLKVRKVELGGNLTPVCASGIGAIFSGGCNIALPFARSKIARLRGDLDQMVRAKVNSPEEQKKIAAALKPRLVVGPAGPVTVATVTSDQKGLVVSFRLAGAE